MNPTKTYLLTITVSILFFSSCINRAYYNSPMQGNMAAYHAAPVASDELKSATYVDGAFTIGGLNQSLRDRVYSFQGGLHRAHVLENFRLNYGASASVGAYSISPYYYYDNRYLDTATINRNAGSKFFGSYGAYAGLSAATPMGRRGEWRYIGVEGSFFNEFGDYATFRKSLADSAATEIDKKKYMGAVGINTELIFKGRSKISSE